MTVEPSYTISAGDREDLDVRNAITIVANIQGAAGDDGGSNSSVASAGKGGAGGVVKAEIDVSRDAFITAQAASGRIGVVNGGRGGNSGDSGGSGGGASGLFRSEADPIALGGGGGGGGGRGRGNNSNRTRSARSGSGGGGGATAGSPGSGGNDRRSPGADGDRGEQPTGYTNISIGGSGGRGGNPANRSRQTANDGRDGNSGNSWVSGSVAEAISTGRNNSTGGGITIDEVYTDVDLHPPANIKATQVSSNAVKLEWNLPITNQGGIDVGVRINHISDNGVEEAADLEPPAGTEETVVSGLDQDVDYEFTFQTYTSRYTSPQVHLPGVRLVENGENTIKISSLRVKRS